MKSHWDLLPKDVVSKIYEYDSTYKEHMTKNVLEAIWKKAWFRMKGKCDSVDTKAVISFLFWKWGVEGYQASIYWYKKHYFPTEFKNYTVENDTCTHVCIHMTIGNTVVSAFNGYVSHYDYFEDNTHIIVFNDDENDLVVYQHLI